MRWVWKQSQVGDLKTCNWFAWIPVQIGCEYRWLEWVSVEYEYEGGGTYDDGIHSFTTSGSWVPVRFLEISTPSS